VAGHAVTGVDDNDAGDDLSPRVVSAGPQRGHVPGRRRALPHSRRIARGPRDGLPSPGGGAVGEELTTGPSGWWSQTRLSELQAGQAGLFLHPAGIRQDDSRGRHQSEVFSVGQRIDDPESRVCSPKTTTASGRFLMRWAS